MKAGVCELAQHQGSTDPEFNDLEEGHGTMVCGGTADDAAEGKHDYQLTKRRRSPRKGRGSSFKADNRSTAPTLMYTPGRRQGSFNHDYSNRRSSRGLNLGAAARPANGLSSNYNKISNANESTPADVRSTVMLRNIPYSMGQSRVLDALFTLGFQSKIDFFYAPLDFSSGNNLGYAFVNLRRPEYVDEFYNRLNDVCLSQLGDAWNVKRLQVCWARVQGFEANVEHYHNSPVIDMPEGYRPIVINDGGSRATFHHHHHQQDYLSNTTYVHRDRSCDETLKDIFSPVTPETSAVTPVRACEASCSGDLQQQQYLTYPEPSNWPSTNIRVNATDRRRYYSRAGRRPDPLDAVGPEGGLLTTPEFIPASMRNGRAHRHHHHHRNGNRRRAYTTDLSAVGFESSVMHLSGDLGPPPSETTMYVENESTTPTQSGAVASTILRQRTLSSSSTSVTLLKKSVDYPDSIRDAEGGGGSIGHGTLGVTFSPGS
ncbi:hypothetical protein FOZ63_022193 [Perkinsus olseni]|uniref:Mei2-like C-terminal RNA recognition motif domain-containing protein n=1 Tax=Perkinsus olseni TaxID=32597 RepID=A0A7J6QMA7_PEROL|nr:hypothetical protein FOZ63_022193 [Perkinsus olseni]